MLQSISGSSNRDSISYNTTPSCITYTSTSVPSWYVYHYAILNRLEAATSTDLRYTTSRSHGARFTSLSLQLDRRLGVVLGHLSQTTARQYSRLNVGLVPVSAARLTCCVFHIPATVTRVSLCVDTACMPRLPPGSLPSAPECRVLSLMESTRGEMRCRRTREGGVRTRLIVSWRRLRWSRQRWTREAVARSGVCGAWRTFGRDDGDTEVHEVVRIYDGLRGCVSCGHPTRRRQNDNVRILARGDRIPYVRVKR